MKQLLPTELTFIELFKTEKAHIAFNARTFSFFKVDQITYKILDYIKRNYSSNISLEEIAKNCDTTSNIVIEVLTKLTTNKLLRERPKVIETPSDSLTLVLNIVDACNFSCTYCHASKYCRQPLTAQNKTNETNKTMSYNIAKKAISFFLKTCQENKIKKIHIILFGGEPLLNFKLVKRITTFAEKEAKNNAINLSLYIVTNGVLLTNNILKYLDNHNFILTISIDGNKEAHNNFRVYHDGTGTYDDVASKVKQVLNMYKNPVHASTTIAKGNNLYESFNHITELGFKFMNVSIVVSAETKTEITETEIQTFIESEKKIIHRVLREQIIAGKNLNYMPLQRIISSLKFPDFPNLRNCCGAGYRYFTVNREGNIYPCSAFIGQNELCMGNVKKFFNLKNEKTHITFRETTVDKRVKCNNCWAIFFCGGGCYYESYIQHNNAFIGPSEKYCLRMQSLVKAVISELVDLSNLTTLKNQKMSSEIK